ncbi:hypothetical protein [Streptomyces sp. NPDC046727]|uniref:hypothetical protein n=1 Tax=Streptomyces sp. NPDC046727 TaxID=3155373 RepID=UPI0033D0BF9B
MLTGLVTDVGRKLAERWAAALVLPGLVFTALAATGLALGQRHWADLELLRHRLRALTAGGSGSTRTAVLLLAVLAASFAAALLADALAGPYERALHGSWPRPLHPLARRLTERRQRAWDSRDAACTAARNTGALAEREAERNAVALVRPECPTWTGDRMRAPATRIRLHYRIELADVWPRLWLLLPDTTRLPLAESRQRLDEATRLGGWAVLYALLGAVWWPAALAGAGAGLVACRRVRERAEEYAELVESAVDVHLPDLFDRFDEETHPIRPTLGHTITEHFRKGAGARRR